MLTKPSKNKNLFGLKNYFLELTNLFDTNKLPNKILLTGKKGLGKSTLSYHFINYVLSKNEDNSYNRKHFTIHELNKSFKLMNNNTHPNFYSIDVLKDKKNIEINQIRELIIYLNKSSFNDQPRFVLIDNVDLLNINSTNALLKIIEEPNKNVFFILINNKKITSTLKSRCLEFKLNLTFLDTIIVTNNILNVDILEHLNFDLINYYNSPGDFYYLFRFADEHNLNLVDFDIKEFLSFIIDNNHYKNNEVVKNFIFDYIELFFLKIYKTSNFDKSILQFYYLFIEKKDNTNRFNLDQESLFLELKSKILNG
jgi:DNA polymerase III subunit delta'